MPNSPAIRSAGGHTAYYLGRAGARVALSLGLAIPGLAQKSTPLDLTQFSLEDLMKIEVTSVSKRGQKLAKTGAAVFVITQEDIRHSGATNIPDLLRIAPGVDVARLNANTWAISIRGFNGIFADKLLVLIDGRTVYLDSAANVFWDQQDVPLEDIDHIEVIRGPGGTVWGANAVNGVINIITKPAQATQGGLVSAGSGSQDSAQGLVQYGGKLGSKGAYRAFGRYFNVNNALTPGGVQAADGWHARHGGFRADWNLSARDSLTVQGDLFRSDAGQTINSVISSALPLQRTFNDSIFNDGGNILGRWTRSLKNGSDTSLQVFYDYNRRDSKGLDETHHQINLDFDHRFALASRHQFVWGLGYRFEADDFQPGYSIRIEPPRSSRSLFSGFVQDEIQLAPSLSLTVGSKFEHNAFTGLEYEPSAQLVWTPSVRHTLWASAARAIRQPSLANEGMRFDVAVVPLTGGSFGVPAISGNPLLKAEQLRDYEAGYRTQLNRRLSWDVTGFWSFYRRLVTIEPGSPFFTQTAGIPHLVLPLTFDNRAHARNGGTEVSATWDAGSRWRISPGYSFLKMSIQRDRSSQDFTFPLANGDSPAHQFQVRSWVKLRSNLDWDSTLMYVSALAHLGVPSYARLDTRLGWRFGESAEVEIVGQNLLRARHMEMSDLQVEQTQVSRSVFGKVTWRF